MLRNELDVKGQQLYDALVADRKNNGEKVDLKTMQPIAIAFEIGIAAIGALLSIDASLATIARAKRSEMGWKPGDEVAPAG